MGLPEASDEDIRQSVGPAFGDVARLITGSDDPNVLCRFQRLTFRFVAEYIGLYVRPDPAVQKALDALCRCAKLAVCSNSDSAYLNPMLEALELWWYFQLVWAKRPAFSKAEAIPVILSKLNARSGVFVGDRAEDVFAARQAGIPVVGIRSPDFPGVTDGADMIVDNRRQMLRAIRTLLNGR
jgi:phosphoglycolate phosphatase-like HAD superfamily hydrolase